MISTPSRNMALLVCLGTATALSLGCEQSPAASQQPSTAPSGSAAAAPASAASGSATGAPAEGPPLQGVTDAALGNRGGCVLQKDGAVACFGEDLVARPTGVGDVLQLAVVDGYLCIVSTKGKLACVDRASGARTELPVYRDGVVMVGGMHTFLVRTEDGVLRGGFLDPKEPEPKPPSGMPGLKDPTAFGLGTTLGCGVLEHTVWCWNTEGGHGMPSTMAPVPAARSVAVGRERICVDTDAGDVWCYAADRKAKPAKLEGWTDVAGLSVAYGAAVRDRLCALGTDGTVRCAELAGDGDAAKLGEPRPVAGLSPAARLVTGASESSCAITRSGELWCWGRGESAAAPVRSGSAKGDGAASSPPPTSSSTPR